MAHRFRRHTSGLAAAVVAAAVVASIVPMAAVADETGNTVISVEGESPTATNMVPGAAAQTGASGGQSLRLYTSAAPPAEGYQASYTVASAEAGIYDLEATTIPIGVAWASPYTFQVNDGAWRTTASARQVATVSAELKTYRLGTVALVAGENVLRFRVNDRRVEPNTNYVGFFDRFTLTPVSVEIAGIATTAAFGTYESGSAVSATITLNAPAPAATEVAWTATDYWGSAMASGTATVAPGASSATVALGSALPTGAYALTAAFPGTPVSRTGSFVVLPASGSRIPTTDSPFAADVYGSKLIPAASATEFAHVLALTGVDWIRDRQRWNNTINPAPGQISFAGEQQAQAWLQAAGAAGLKTLSSFHDAPTWTRTSGRNLPQDLRDAYAFGLAAGQHYDGLVDAWQLWNEQNRGFALDAEGADRYASVLKAVALGFLDSGTDAELITGGLAGVDPHYAQMQFRNDILNFVDGFAYHTHTTGNTSASVNQLPDFASQLTAAEPFGGAQKERWVTESGIALQTPDASALPSSEQEKTQARYIVTSAAQSLARGTTKHFFFIAAPYREGVNYWSLFRSETEPMAALAAQSVMTWKLGEGQYLGRLTGLPTGAEGYVFDTGEGPTAVLWAPEVVDADLHVTGATTVVDLMGRTMGQDADGGTVAVGLGPDPVYVSADGFSDLTAGSTTTPAAAKVTAGDFGDADRVVIQQRYDTTASASAQSRGYALSTTAPNPLTIEAYNFGDQPVTAQLTVASDGGWSVTPAQSTVTIPAGGRAEVGASVSATADLVDSLSDIRVTATVGAATSSASVVDVRPAAASSSANHVVIGSDNRLDVTYTNRGTTSKQVTAVEWTFGTTPSTTTPVATTVPGGASAVFRSPPVSPGAGQMSYVATVRFAGGGSSTVRGELSAPSSAAVTPVIERTLDVDGDMADVADLAPIHPTAPGIDAPDLKADAWFTWDQSNLYLAAVVTDDMHNQTFTDGNTWRGDGLQLGVSPNWPGETRLRPEIQPRVELGVALTPSGPQLYRFGSVSATALLVSGADIAIVRDETAGVTRYEAAIPWTLLSGSGITIADAASLSLSVNDVDDSGGRSWLEWGAGITTSKDTELFRPVVFQPA